MKCSANEVMALAAKAARGAGAPPAQAMEFGRAAQCHLRAGRDAVPLIAALEALPLGPILEMPLAITRLAERASDGSADATFPLADDDDLMLSYLEAHPFAEVLRIEAGRVHLRLSFDATPKRGAALRIDVPDSLQSLFLKLAEKTYVPESDASRRAGAGAGLTDND